MNIFNSLQEARDFINKQAFAYVQHLRSLGSNIGSVPFAWHVNHGALMDMFVKYRYSSSDPYAIQALNNAAAAGYIEMNGLGGVMITPIGYKNIGNW